jgi:hypothetical protein
LQYDPNIWFDEDQRTGLNRPISIQQALREARLDGAYLRDADLSGADLFKVSLLGVNLNRANLTSAKLEKANLRNVVLVYANLMKANLMGPQSEYFRSRRGAINAIARSKSSCWKHFVHHRQQGRRRRSLQSAGREKPLYRPVHRPFLEQGG